MVSTTLQVHPCLRARSRQAKHLDLAVPCLHSCSLTCTHDDAGRERISSKNVAHIMNNEAQRKYLVSVKRLMTYLQDKRTDVAPSKKVR